MTPYGATVARELRSALVPLETVSIVDHRYLSAAMRALVKNALFWVVPTPRIEAAREAAVVAADRLAGVIHDVGVQSQGISLDVDHARADALVAFEALIDAVADAEPTQSGKSLGIG